MQKSLSILAMSILALPAHADNVFPPGKGSTLTWGRGYNSVNGYTKQDCVIVSSVRPIAAIPNPDELNGGTRVPDGSQPVKQVLPTGQTVTYNLSIIKTAADLRKSLGIDAKASFGFGGMGGDAAVEYFHEQHITSSTLYVVLNVKVTNTSEVMEHLELTPDAYKMLEDGDLRSFMDSCGDSFIAGRTTGGEFSSVIKIEASSESERQKIETELSAGGFGFSASEHSLSKLNSVKSKYNASFEMFKRGGVGALPKHDDLNAIFEYARNLPVLLESNKNPEMYLLTALNYDTVKKPKSNTTLLKEKRALEKMAINKDAANDELSKVTEIINNNVEYFRPNIDPLRAYRNTLNSILEIIEQAGYICEENPEKCVSPRINFPEIAFPRLKTQAEQVEAMSLNHVKLIFRTTNQELDHDSMLDVILRRKSDGAVIGTYYLHREHGKEWTDNTTNTIDMVLDDRIAATIVNKGESELYLKMTPNGNNKWRYSIEADFSFNDAHLETYNTGACELNGRGDPVSAIYQCSG